MSKDFRIDFENVKIRQIFISNLSKDCLTPWSWNVRYLEHYLFFSLTAFSAIFSCYAVIELLIFSGDFINYLTTFCSHNCLTYFFMNVTLNRNSSMGIVESVHWHYILIQNVQIWIISVAFNRFCSRQFAN